jgi:hypothetical protein
VHRKSSSPIRPPTPQPEQGGDDEGEEEPEGEKEPHIGGPSRSLALGPMAPCDSGKFEAALMLKLLAQIDRRKGRAAPAPPSPSASSVYEQCRILNAGAPEAEREVVGARQLVPERSNWHTRTSRVCLNVPQQKATRPEGDREADLHAPHELQQRDEAEEVLCLALHARILLLCGILRALCAFAVSSGGGADEMELQRTHRSRRRENKKRIQPRMKTDSHR